MTQQKLYMVLLGCTPNGRLTEQHDIFFGIGESVLGLKADMYAFWPDGGQLHVDSWREVTHINGYNVAIVPKSEAVDAKEKLFFLNLGGYKPGEFEEYHYKALIVAPSMGLAIRQSKKTTFYKHYGFKGAESHIDEKYGLDVDDMHKVEDILPAHLKDKYHIAITKTDTVFEDELHIGYLKLGKR
ncbi:DUF1543 domain-containing protein [Flavobacterium zepuense]|nr:DUF1543 domain-containing protein [Flavobacterium zepuense]